LLSPAVALSLNTEAQFYGDVPVAVPMFAALYYVLRGVDKGAAGDRDAGLKVVAAGVLAGLAAGAKLTMGIYSIALAVALVATLPRRFVFLQLCGYVAGNIFGFLVTSGYHLFRMWRLFSNPVFPFMNNVFQSPFWENVSTRDERFLPKSISDFFFYPFEWAIYSGGGFASELAFRDIRIAAVMSLAAVVLVLWGARSLTVKPVLVMKPM